jgi:hypothetical protein
MNTRQTYIGNTLSIVIAPPIPPITPANSIYGATNKDILYLQSNNIPVTRYSTYRTHKRSNGTWSQAHVYEFNADDYDRIVELLIARYPQRRVRYNQYV